MNYICNVKFIKNHIGRFLFSIAFLLALGNNAIAFESWTADITNQQTSLEKESEQNRSKAFDKVSLVKAAQTITTQEYLGAGWMVADRSDNSIVVAALASHHTTNYYLEDQRRLIARYLYPFHYHW